MLQSLALSVQFDGNKSRWLQRPPGLEAYTVDVSVLDPEIASRFVMLSESDAETRAFLASSRNEGSSLAGKWSLFVKHKIYVALIDLLGWTRVDASAYVRRARMFVASPTQLGLLLSRARPRSSESGEQLQLLDIGAGRGSVTHALSTALGIANPRDVLALESSSVLRRELEHRWGFRVGASLDSLGSSHVDTVALFNVLDRVDDPERLLRAAVGCLRPGAAVGGLLVLATVLPFHGFVQLPYDRQRSPSRPLELRHAKGARHLFEQRAAAFVEAVMRSASETRTLRLLSWTRLPYLSSADVGRSHYALDNALFVFSATAADPKPPTAHNSNQATSAGRASQAGHHARRHASPRPHGSPGPHGSRHPGRRLSLLLDWMRPRAKHQADGRSGNVSRAAAERGGSACGEPDQIFRWISATLAREGLRSWGEVLDAGTGKSSLCWIVRHSPARVDAVTAASSGIYSQQVAQRVARGANAQVDVVLGNWRDAELLRGRTYDVVVADFLIGAVEGFWPFGQDAVLDKLLRLVRPGGYLLFVGLEPYELLFHPTDPVRRIEALGDAAALLSGTSGSSYREMPQAWVRRQLEKSPGFRLVDSREFPSELGPTYARSQLAYASDQADSLPNAALRAAFRASAASLRAEVAPRLKAKGRNYAIVARREAAKHE